MRNIGLVLSGGMAKGAYQLGALRAIMEVFKPSDFRYVSSASIGALNAYAFLTNGLDKADKIWRTDDYKHHRKWVTAMLKSSYPQESISKILSDVKFNNHFYIPLVNLRRRKLSYVDLVKVPAENIESYLRASVAIPIFNPAVKLNDEFYYDGAMVDNIPVRPLLKHTLEYIICIYFENYNYIFENEYLDNKIIKMNFADNNIISNSICFKNESISYMIDEGYAKAKRILEFVLSKGIDDTDAIYSRIEDLNAMNATGRSFRITGDVIVNNMNKITRKFMNKIEIL